MAQKALLLFILISFTVLNQLRAQDKGEIPTGWSQTLTAGLNITQVSLHNWVQGGESTFAWTFLVNGRFHHKQESFLWSNVLKLTYGQTKLGSADFEKTDDELFYESIYSHNVGWVVNPYGALTVRTQLAPGYKILDSLRTQTSAFFDPGYLMQSAGFTYQPSDHFSTRLGVAVKETFTSQFTLFGYADDPKTTEVEKTRVQTGIESGTSVKYPFMENMLFTSQLNLFSAFDHLDVWDVRWDNTITAKVNQYVNVTLNALVIHEIAQTRKTQVKQTLALGLSYTLF